MLRMDYLEQRGRKETSEETTEIIVWRDDVGVVQGDCSGGCEMLNFGHNLKVGQTGL